MRDKRTALRGLYAITPPGIERALLLERVGAALAGGARIVQYRDKERSGAEKADLADALCVLCHRFDALLIINDDVALAQAVAADGVHLGSADGNLARARALLGEGRIVGASCYADLVLARAAHASGADYVAFGAIHRSPSKPQAPLAPLSLLGACRAELAIPVCAIGGITLDNAPALISAGVDLLAVITDLFESGDVGARAFAFQRLFAESHREPM